MRGSSYGFYFAWQEPNIRGGLIDCSNWRIADHGCLWSVKMVCCGRLQHVVNYDLVKSGTYGFVWGTRDGLRGALGGLCARWMTSANICVLFSNAWYDSGWVWWACSSACAYQLGWERAEAIRGWLPVGTYGRNWTYWDSAVADPGRRLRVARLLI